MNPNDLAQQSRILGALRDPYGHFFPCATQCLLEQHDSTKRRQAMDLIAYRTRPAEQERIADLLRLLPTRGQSALDVGARDGYLSQLLAERYEQVVALDLKRPAINHPRISPEQGDAANLLFPDRYFDVVLCAEVLEHIPPQKLEKACAEIVRVSRHTIVIGVPFKQDLRLGRTTCMTCGRPNPPWGHVNSFDEARLQTLFAASSLESVSFVGKTRARTNWLSCALMDFAGNPYGTWEQDEACVHCGGRIGSPGQRTLLQRLATRLATRLTDIQIHVTPVRGNWLHAVFNV